MKPQLKGLIRIGFISIALLAVVGGVVFVWRKPAPASGMERVSLPPGVVGKIAIVLDDWGYSTTYCALAREIHYPLTMAVMPYQSCSRKVADEFRDRGVEVILHQPMQWGASDSDPRGIQMGMDENAVRKVISDNLENVGRVTGINNHLGSKTTTDSETMGNLMAVLRDHDLYFLDSRTTPQSVGAETAWAAGLKSERNGTFLDNKNDPEYIKDRMDVLKAQAREFGFAIGIGHARRTTLELLPKLMSEAEKEGFMFVSLFEVIHTGERPISEIHHVEAAKPQPKKKKSQRKQIKAMTNAVVTVPNHVVSTNANVGTN